MDSDQDMHDISPDELDDALETLWHGRSGAFERLLNRHGESDAGVGDMFGDVVSRGMPETAPDAVPAIANYTIRSELGRGGMGVIYEARQHHPPRDVALKVIRGSHLPDAQQKRLFNREIQSLARLKHPNVADIHEAGVTDDGRPFFAMELVLGKTLSEFAGDLPTDTRSETQRIRTLLGVFQKICDAISYAHQRGVIHRDLKPSNIIVTEPAGGSGSGSLTDMGPGVKVVDFGLARITDPDVAATVTTDAGQIRGTFAYMAPEQIQGDPADIDIRSDVYALGVLLFEVLTGRLPYDLKHSSVGKVIRIICETAPTRPSTLNSALRGDLETIIWKTLSKNPDHRYQSVNALGEDIARFLADQPILARPDTFHYRGTMFIRRNKWAVGLASAFVFSLITGLVVTTGLYRDAASARTAERAARENAESRAAEAEQTAAFFADMLGSVSPGFAKGRDMTVIREVLDRASDEVATELAEFPQAEATLRSTIGNTYRLMGDYDRAAPHLEAALALNIRLHGEDSLEVAEVLHKQAVLAEAVGDYDGAGELLVRQLLIREREGDRVGIAVVWSGQARLASLAGDRAEMLAKAELARDVFLDELGEKEERTVKAMGLVAGAHMQFGRFAEAVDEITRLVELWNEIKGPMHPDTIITEANLAMLLRHLKRNEEAEVRLAQVVDRAALVFGEAHKNTLAARTSLAQTLQALERYDEAEAQVRIAVDTLRQSVGERHPDTLHAMSVLGSVLRGAGQFDESVAVLRESYELHVEVMGQDAPGTNATATALASVLIEAGAQHWPEAETMLTDAVERLVTLGGLKFQLTQIAVKQLRNLYAPDAMDRPDKLAELDERFGAE